jgi:CubicO group peptidase (beta-lactamase class C family)
MHVITRSASAALVALLLVTAQLPAVAGRSEPSGLSAERLKRIGQMIERRIAANDISGAVTLIARKGRIAHFEAHGLMDIQSKKPMSRDALFWIASMTKPIAAVAILMLNEEGRLRLNDPVSRFIPQYADLKVAVPLPGATAGSEGEFRTVPANRQITIRDLLTHTSGIVTGAGISAREAAKIARQPTDTLADRIPRLALVPLEFQPGTQWQYSPGVGFDVLGRIVEVASGQTFDQFLRQRIFDPLGMKNTSFNVSEPQKLRLAMRYQRTPSGLQTQEPRAATTYFSGAGGLVSSAEDYLQFAQMLLNRGQLNGQRVLSPRAVDIMRSVHIPDTLPGRQAGEGYGLGVRVVTSAAARSTLLSDGSYGWAGAAGTRFWIDPREQLVAILMVHTPAVGLGFDFENVVMQAVLDE